MVNHYVIHEITSKLNIWAILISFSNHHFSSTLSFSVHEVCRKIVVSQCKWRIVFPCQPREDLQWAAGSNDFSLQGGWLLRSEFSLVKGIKAIIVGPLKRDRCTNVRNQICFKKGAPLGTQEMRGQWVNRKPVWNRPCCCSIREENVVDSCCSQSFHARCWSGAKCVWVCRKRFRAT